MVHFFNYNTKYIQYYLATASCRIQLRIKARCRLGTVSTPEVRSLVGTVKATSPNRLDRSSNNSTNRNFGGKIEHKHDRA